MRKMFFIGIVCALACVGCNKPSKVEQYRAEKHVRDSIGLVEQQRSMVYYQSMLDSLMPQADSLLAYFKYEKNEKYQDHGFYVVRNQKLKVYDGSLRVMVRDDGQDLLAYRNGKRLTETQINSLKDEKRAVDCAQHLQIVIRDIKELERRIERTSLEIQKYEKRLKNEN
jgi:hypothetical protein